MRKILKIIGVQEKRTSNSVYYKTLALVDDGTECWGFGDDFKVGDEVMVYLHKQYDEIKMEKPKD